METAELVILTGGPRHGTPSVRDPYIGVELSDGNMERPNRCMVICCFRNFKTKRQ